jgi:thiamine transport system permease protein
MIQDEPSGGFEMGDKPRRTLRQRIAEALDRLSSKKKVNHGVYIAGAAVFFAFILLPPILGILINWGLMQQVLVVPDLMSQALAAIQNSFIIAILVSAIDIVTAVPLAWLIARKRARWINILDTLSDIPFIVPTVALGYSLLLFWNGPEGISGLFSGSLVSPGWVLIILLHFTFSYPVVVRVVVGALLDYKREYENAARTLGAPPLTAARTVTFPIIKTSLIAAFILAFSRSLSETGATQMVAGLFENGSLFILRIQTTYVGATVFASSVLIAVAVLIFMVVRFFGPKLRLPVDRTWPSFDRRLSYVPAERSRNTVTLLIFFSIVLLPSLFVALPAFEAAVTPTLSQAMSGTGIWTEYWQGLILSYVLASVATVLNVVIGLPTAIWVARRKFGKLPSGILDLLVNIPLVVPSVALGFSLRIFWKQTFTFIPDFLLLVFAHMAITYPYFVRSMSAAVERIGMDLEEASRTLGAKPLGTFRTIIVPLTKYSIFSGAVLMFTRSVSETGATTAVATQLRTAPVVLVDWVPRLGMQNIPATPLEIGLGCGFLILFSFVILLALRFIVRGRGRY